MTTNQSASLAVGGELKRELHFMEPQAPQTCGAEAPSANSGFFTVPDRPIGLAALEARLREDLERLCLPTPAWLARSDDDPVLDVAIVGAGQAGLAAAAALRLIGVDRIRIFDRNPPGREGPWLTHARMQTLRSPKHLLGPALELPSLTFRAWYEAQYGKPAWEALDRIERPHWQHYLNWFRTVLALPVTNQAYVENIRAGATTTDGAALIAFDLVTTRADGRCQRQTLNARHLVLATGMDALGGPAIPRVAKNLPRQRWQHSAQAIDFAPWRGQRLGVVGGGDAALDAAATALEAGVAQVDVFVRAADFSRINYWKAFAHIGHYNGWRALSAQARQPLLDFLKRQKTPPARGTVQRLARFDNVRLHFNSPVQQLALSTDGAIALSTPHATYALDHLIFATGYCTDLSLRPELAQLAPHIRWWHERTPPHPADFALDGFPETSEDFSLIARDPAACPILAQVHLFTGAALMSQGKLSGDIPGIGFGATTLARGIAARLYAADFPRQLSAVQAYDELEVRGDEWARIRVDHPLMTNTPRNKS